MEFEQEYRFRSDFLHDLKLHKEFNRGTRDTRLFHRLIYLYIIGIFVWMFWYLVVWMDVPEVYADTAMFSCGIWTLVEIIWLFMTRGGGVHYKRNLMLSGGKPTNDAVLFCEDHILTLEKESGNKATILYDNIRRVSETDNLLLLSMRYNTYLMVDKRGLSCTKEELGQFLYEKCPKLRHKKVRTHKWGVILRRTAWVVVLVSFLCALYFHPRLQIRNRIQGQIHNGMTAAEIAAELEIFGIGTLDEAQLEAAEAGYGLMTDSKLEYLLYVLGDGSRDILESQLSSAETGVFYSYYWSYAPQTMYEDLLQGISAMSRGGLEIENIREDHSKTNWETWEGTITVDFSLNGQEQSIDAVFYGEYYDEQILNTLNGMIPESTGKQLYFADFDDIGCFVFYGDEDWAERFMARTGMTLSPDINDVY